MEYNQLTCGNNSGNTGLQECAENFGYFSKFIIVPKSSEFATITAATDLDNWTTALNDDKAFRFYPTPEIVTIEADSEEAVYQELIAGKREFIREGKDRMRVLFETISLHNHKQLQNHNGRKDLAVYIVTSNGYILGYSKDNVKFLPLTLDEIHFEKRTISDGETKDRSGVSLVFENSDQWNKLGVWINPSTLTTDAWDANTDIFGVKDMRLTAVSTAATASTITVAGWSDSKPVEGLVLGDFSLKTSAGVSVTINTLTDNGNGSYTLAYASISGAHVISLKGQPTGTTKFVEGFNTLAFTI